MRNKLIVILVLFCCTWASADTYTIGNDGDDYTTHAAMNAGEDVEPGDIISFRKGEVFREQCTVEDSGTSGNIITYTAHGTGADPIINGADVTTTWAEAGTWTTTWTKVTGDDVSSDSDYNYRNILAAGVLSTSGTKVRITITGHSANAGQVDGASIGERDGSTDDMDGAFNGTFQRLLFSTNAYGTIPAAGTLVSDVLTFNLDEAKDYLVHLWFDDNHLDIKSGSAGDGRYISAADSGVDGTEVQTVSYNLQAGQNHGVSKVEVWNVVSNVYSVACNWTCRVVVEDGTLLTQVAWDTDLTTTAAAMSAGTWTLDTTGDLLYVWATDNADPDTHTMEVARDGRCIYIEQKDYITIEDLSLKFSNGDGIGIWGNGGNGSDNIIIDGCTIRGFNFGIMSYESKYIEIKNCTIYDGQGVGTSGTVGHGIYIDSEAEGRTDDVLIENCTIYNNYGTGVAIAGRTGGAYGTKDVIIRYNYIHGNDSDKVDSGNGIQMNDVESIDIYYNITKNNGLREISIGQDGIAARNINVYNNTCTGTSGSSYPVIVNVSNTVGINIKNNIIKGVGDNVPLIKDHGSGATINNNCYYSTGNYNNAWSWNGDDDIDSFADWQTNSSQDASGINANPLFVDAANDDFRLKYNSPCINVGTDVSLTADYADQIVGDPPEMGVYSKLETLRNGVGNKSGGKKTKSGGK